MLVKPGYLTTEFWVSVITIAGTAITALAGSLPERYAAIAAAVTAGLYALARGLAKRPTVATTAPVTVQSVQPVSTTAPPTQTAGRQTTS